MTRVKNIKNRKMTREEQIPIIKQFEAHSFLMMSSLDVAMTKIRELEEENLTIKTRLESLENWALKITESDAFERISSQSKLRRERKFLCNKGK